MGRDAERKTKFRDQGERGIEKETERETGESETEGEEGENEKEKD